MNTTTSRRTVKSAPLTRGTCRLTFAQKTLADALTSGAAILSIRPDNFAWADYWLSAIRDERGRLVGYRLEKLVSHPEERAPVYDIDCSFGGGPQFWVCDCADATYRNRNGCGGCKHVRSLAAALERQNETAGF